MTQYSSQNPQQYNQPGNRQQRGDDGHGQSRWHEDSWHNREAGWDRDRDRGEYDQQQRAARGDNYYSGYGQSNRSGQNWQQEAQPGREQNLQQGYRGGDYGAMGRWPRNEDRENYGQQDYSFGNQGRSSFGNAGGYGGDEYWREDNFGNPSYGSSQSYPGRPGGPNSGRGQQWSGSNRQSYGQSDYGSQQRYSQQGGFGQPDYSQSRGGPSSGYYPQEYSSVGNWGSAAGAGRYQSQGAQQNFRGSMPKGYARSDERIKEDICERLTEDPYIDASEITIEVTAGVVTLEGVIEDRSQKHRAEDLVDATSGVKDVHNRLNVSRRSESSTGSQFGGSTSQSTQANQTGQTKTTAGSTSTTKQ
jgi:osmotically-inducible protein OsmY